MAIQYLSYKGVWITANIRKYQIISLWPYRDNLESFDGSDENEEHQILNKISGIYIHKMQAHKSDRILDVMWRANHTRKEEDIFSSIWWSNPKVRHVLY